MLGMIKSLGFLMISERLKRDSSDSNIFRDGIDKQIFCLRVEKDMGLGKLANL